MKTNVPAFGFVKVAPPPGQGLVNVAPPHGDPPVAKTNMGLFIHILIPIYQIQLHIERPTLKNRKLVEKIIYLYVKIKTTN